MKRLALALTAALLVPTLAHGATLTVSAINPFGVPSTGTVGLMLAVDPQDSATGFLAVQSLSITGAHQIAAGATLAGILGSPNVQTGNGPGTNVALANAIEPAVNWTRDDSYWRATAAAPDDWALTATGIQGGGVGDGFMELTATATPLPVSYTGPGAKDIAYIVISDTVTVTGDIARLSTLFPLNHVITTDGQIVPIPEPSPFILLALAGICAAPWLRGRSLSAHRRR